MSFNYSEGNLFYNTSKVLTQNYYRVCLVQLHPLCCIDREVQNEEVVHISQYN